MSRKPATAVATKATRSRKPAPAPEPVVDRGAAISAGCRELSEVRAKARAKRNGTPAKQLIFSEWLKALSAGKAFDVDVIAKRFPEVKRSSIGSWSSHWLRNNGVGPGYPANAKNQEKAIRAAIKKAVA